jgi:2-keto-4-pentenoate hydratase/2-oxohepta-3-ene-1,7-dioic acid hydratase in catechol pathway
MTSATARPAHEENGMKFVEFNEAGRRGLAVEADSRVLRGWREGEEGYPGSLHSLIVAGGDALTRAGEKLAGGVEIEPDAGTVLPPISEPGKIICVGLNYREHAAESNVAPPAFPTIFSRFASSLIGHGSPIVRSRISTQLDYEGELVAVVGKAGRHIPRSRALDHVAGYSIFNDVSVRDIQLRTPQWTLGKNFDGTGAFGPCLVTADDLPPGARGLRLVTRLNGAVVQDASTDDLIFDVATLVAEISSALTLMPGDLIVTGTPSGVGMARSPQLFMKHGDVCEVEIEGIGTLRNTVADEQSN